MPTQRLIQVLFDELPQQPCGTIAITGIGHLKIRQMVETMAQEPARWNTLGSGSAFRDERSVTCPAGRQRDGLSFRRWRHQLQLILALQAPIADVMYNRRRKCWVMIPPRHLLPYAKGSADAVPVSDGRVTASHN